MSDETNPIKDSGDIGLSPEHAGSTSQAIDSSSSVENNASLFVEQPDGGSAKLPDSVKVAVKAVSQQIQDHEAWSLLLDAEWREKLQAQLAERLNSASETKEKEATGGRQVNDFTDQLVALVDRLGKVSSIVLRIFPSSSISRSSRLFRDISVTLLLRFTENANVLFPDAVTYPFMDPFFEDVFRKINSKGKSVSLRANTSASSAQYPQSEITSESFLTLLELLASSIDSLTSDFEKFMDYMKVTSNEELTSVHDSIMIFEENLKYWAKSAKSVDGGNLSALYKHNLMFEVGEHLVDISGSLDKLIATGLPKIEDDFKEAQKVAQTESLALLTISTFFTSITASTLGYSFQQTSNVFDVVNFFWFCSLIFSIASVMNSLLAYSWKHSVYRKRSGDDQLPWFIGLWSKETPLYFLVTSAMTFSVGLCLFAYASGQSKLTSAATTILTSISALGITGATTWFILEYHSIDELWLFAKACKDRLSTIWSDITSKLDDFKDKLREKMEDSAPWIISTYRKIKDGLGIPMSYLYLVALAIGSKVSSFFRWVSELGTRMKDFAKRVTKKIRSVPSPLSRHNSALEAIVGGMDQDGKPQSTVSDSEKGSGNVEEVGDEKRAPLLSLNSAVKSAVLMKRWRSKVARKTSVQESPIEGLISAFKTIKPKYVEDIAQSVDCISFSPDGKLLSLCNAINCKIYSTQPEPFKCLVTIEDKGTGDNMFSVIGRMAWSPRGTQFIITTRTGVLVYELNVNASINDHEQELETKQLRSINCNLDARFATAAIWYPQGEAFVTVNNFSVKNFSIVSTGQALGIGTLSLRTELRTGEAEEINIHDVLFVGKKPRLIIAATLTISFGGVKVGGHKSKSQTQLIVYDLEKHCVESRIPVFNTIRGLNVSKDHSVLLVGFVDKPPQLWHIEGNDESSAQTMLSLSPQCVYESKLTSFAGDLCRGRAFFYGNNDELVICWDYYNDEFHVWDRQYAVPLYVFENWYRGGSLQGMDVNRTNHALMFATGSFNGDLTIWRTSDGEDEEQPVVTNDADPVEPDNQGEGSGGDAVHQESRDVEGNVGTSAVDNSPAYGDGTLESLVEM